MHRRTILLGGALSVSLLALVACGNKAESAQTTQPSATAREAAVKGVSAVCLYDGVGLFEGPTAEKGVGKYSGTLSLGEVVTFTGRTEEGKSYGGEAATFYKVRTSVDDEGWVQELFFALDARPAVVTKETLRYQRDNATSALGSEKVPPMTVVALLQEKGDWVRVDFGGRKDAPFLSNYAGKDFWVKKDVISVSEEDVTVAVLGLRAVAMDDKEKKAEALEGIVNDGAYADSEFILPLRNELAKIREGGEIQVNVNVN